MHRTLLVLAGLVALAQPVAAQGGSETLADIRQELTVLYVEVKKLTQELSTTGASGAQQLPPSVIDRVNVIESELQRLTAQTEELQFRVDRIVKDGTNRIGDLEFRLCELEDACDVSKLGDTPTLGGGVLPAPPATAASETGGGAQLAMGERADFDRAEAALSSGDTASAARLFATFAETYPAGPLTPRAHLLAGDAHSQLGETRSAATAYLNAFSAEPAGGTAPQALLKLGESLGTLGQTDEACVMLGEVGARFPGSAEVTSADAARSRLGCP
ncbi:tol-pal system protein YbgF [Tropicimonas sp.]|uniref:tol-pal system protein YbgF n=1 Tax=Tropicimonas sp. TaxID=2067044 RepID=UPI003A878885